MFAISNMELIAARRQSVGSANALLKFGVTVVYDFNENSFVWNEINYWKRIRAVF